MPSVTFLTLEQVLAIHHDQITRWGGSSGIRDLHLLASAIARPQTTFSGKDLYPSIFLKAAALMHSIILNHPFIDGNKRTGVVVAARFLYINNYRLSCTHQELIRITLQVEAKQTNLSQLATWLQQNSKKL